MLFHPSAHDARPPAQVFKGFDTVKMRLQQRRYIICLRIADFQTQPAAFQQIMGCFSGDAAVKIQSVRAAEKRHMGFIQHFLLLLKGQVEVTGDKIG